jgi:ElaB/YqjD/DUF883 family membrane-anchored ribosome-binding protein
MSEEDEARENARQDQRLQARSRMENAIREYRQHINECSMSDDDFAEGVNDAVRAATDGDIEFEPWCG